MKKIFVACPTPQDKQELLRLSLTHDDYTFIFQNYETEELERLIYEDGSHEGRVDNIPAMIDSLVETYRHESLTGAISSDDYPGINIAAGMAQQLGLPAPSPEKILLAQHKYYARCLQQKYVPEATPRFSVVPMSGANTSDQSPLPYPFFLKPVKSVFSCFAQSISSDEEFQKFFKGPLPTSGFLEPYNQLLQRYTNVEYDAYNLVAEELLSGFQATIEGYSYNGEVEILGITDSIMYPGTISFKRFDYPSSLPQEVQERTADIARRCMQGIGFDNGMFNIEFFYNETTNAIHIIEINPRMASQFADLYEKVDGTNSYELLVQLALNQKPTFKRRQGPYKKAASCVLREFENKYTTRIPDAAAIAQMYRTFPDVRFEIFAELDRTLSYSLQDGKSYRYGLINLGADTDEGIQTKFEQCKQILNITFL